MEKNNENNLDKIVKNIMLEKKIQVSLWEHLKSEFLYDDTVETLFLDDSDNIIVINCEYSIIIISYLHIGENYDKNSDYDNHNIIKSLIDFYNDLISLNIEKGFNCSKFIIVTTFKLSDYVKMNFSTLPKNLNYYYLTANNDDKKRNYELRIDNDILDLINGDIISDEIFNYVKLGHMKDIKNEDLWNCDICDGNQNTGCLYFDPTECPKFT